VGWLDWLFVALSHVGTLGLVWLVLALVVAVGWRQAAVLVRVLAADLFADMSAYVLKAIIPVERPSLRYPEPRPLVHTPHDHSFPSGHAATSFACAAVLAAAVPRFRWLFYVLAAAIALSRVYVGVHYPLDVVAGAALGLLVATALLRGEAALRRSSRARRSG
jgi:undecaprenyl-diphosphatase